MQYSRVDDKNIYINFQPQITTWHEKATLGLFISFIYKERERSILFESRPLIVDSRLKVDLNIGGTDTDSLFILLIMINVRNSNISVIYNNSLKVPCQ